ncbi:type II secretion system F family protein [Virgisporangium ochraceum]|uniref:Type II secretion system protein n=1 Tax=Virgisporangium ochraceum TaxID=65505 RepID=A0A8J4A431_9ACTN|nr:type II secretion system F family protein [Virgisporangium ochraceum]GIJ74152.1 type II secretion system protein [Virgisporangium ochraceum]
MTGALLLAGVGTGLGVWLMLIGWFPRPPRLESALDPDPSDPAAYPHSPTEAGQAGWSARLGRPGARWLRRAGLPRAGVRRDLVTLDKPVEVHLAEQATAIVFGLLLPPAAVGLVGVAGGAGAGAAVPVVASLILGTAGFFAADLSARSEAAKHRAAFRDALSSFLDLVVISLAAGSGVDQALDEAAAIGSGPAYRELRYALAEARLARVPPWDVLAVLGRRIGLAELQQLAATVALAGTEGAKVRTSLRARAVAMRDRQLAHAEGEANAATERMSLPVVALFAGFLIFLGYPAVAAVLIGL